MALPILTSTELRHRIEAHLKTALPRSCAALAVRTGLPLPAPAWWRQTADGEPDPAERPPGFYVNAGPLAAAGSDSDVLWADAQATVTVAAAGRTRQEATDRAAAYISAARYALLNDVTLGGAVHDMTWDAETPTPAVASGRDRSEYLAYAAVTVTYRVALPRRLPPTLLPPGDPGVGVPVTRITVHALKTPIGEDGP